MRYSYDPEKKAENLKKHGMDFDDARSVIESAQAVTFEDRRFDYGESRYLQSLLPLTIDPSSCPNR